MPSFNPLRRLFGKRTPAIAPVTVAPRRRAVVEELEARLLYSADLAPGLADSLTESQGEHSVVAEVSYFETEQAASNDDASADADSAAEQRRQVEQRIISAPMLFERNEGQSEVGVDYLARGSGYSVFLRDGDAELSLRNGDGSLQTVKLELVGANASLSSMGENEAASKSNYLNGATPVTDVANYGAVRYQNAYDGIDVRYYGQGRQLEYDFIVAAGSDYRDITLNFTGAQGIAIADNGDLVLTLSDGAEPLRFHAPVSYQLDAHGEREAVDSRYVIHADGSVGFEVGAHDSTRTLVIDPTLVWATYLGGSTVDAVQDMTVDASGNVYVTGYTNSSTFTPGGGGTHGLYDVFVTKFNASGGLVYNTFLGGSGSEGGYGIAVDASGQAVVVGNTNSSNWGATFNGNDQTLNGGYDGFIIRLNASGSALTYGSYAGSAGDNDWLRDVALQGNVAYVTGQVGATNSETIVAARFDMSLTYTPAAAPNGLSINDYEVYGRGSGYGIVLDGSGNIYLGGQSFYAGQASTLTSYQSTLSGASDGFIAKLTSLNGTPAYFSNFGGAGDDIVQDVTLDSAGKLVIAGTTYGGGLPANRYDTTFGGVSEGFVSKFDLTQSGAASHVFTTYYGTSGGAAINTLSLSNGDTIFVSGFTSGVIPLTADALDTVREGIDSFIAKFSSDGSALLYSSYLGGAGDGEVNAIKAVGSTLYIAGRTTGTDSLPGYDPVANGSDDGSVSVYDFNSAPPAITSNGGGATANISVTENTTAVTTVTATDDSGSVTYSITGGADAARFTINASTGALSLIAAPNFESPTDVGANNVYNVTVQASDGVSADSQAIAVTVTNVNEAPVITSNGGGASAALSIAENSSAVTTVTSSDPDAGASRTYSISGGADAARFTINSSTGALSFIVAPNYEAPTDSGGNNVYDVIVQVSDGALTDSQSLAVTVTNVNEAPIITSNGGGTNASVSIAENGGAVTTVTATDADAGASLSYTIAGGTDAAKFSINGSTGALSFLAAPNFEVPTDSDGNNVYNVTVQVSDGALTDLQSVAVTVTNVNEAPSITSNGGGGSATIAVTENTSAVTTVTASDPDAGTVFTYSISGGADAARFSINGSTGALSFVSAPNYEAPADANSDNAYQVTVRVSDGTLFNSQVLTVTVSDVNEFGVGAITDTNATANSILENSTNGSLVGITANASDADATNNAITYSLTNDAGGRFAIGAATGVVTVANGSLLDREAAASHNITVRAQSADGSFATQNFTITLADADEFNVGAISDINPGANIVSEGAANGASVGLRASATDADATNNTIAYSLDDDAGGRFAINAASGVVVVADGSLLDYQTTPSHDVIVRATSSDGSFSLQTFTIDVSDTANNPPIISSDGGGANAALSIVENTTAVTTVTATDPNVGNTLSYSIAGGADAGKFSIDGVTGALSFIAPPNYDLAGDADADNVYDVTVQVDDGAGGSDTQNIAVTILNANEAPVITSGAVVSMAENAVTVATIAALDPDAGAALTYSIVGGADAARFSIDGTSGVLSFLVAPNYESPSDATNDNVYDVQVQVTDGALSSVQALTVTVTNVNEAPSITSSGGSASAAFSAAENAVTVTTLTAADPDAGSTLAYSIIGGADAARFAIDSVAGVLSFVSAQDYESPGDADGDRVYEVVVQVSDGTLTANQVISISLTDADEFDASAIVDTNATTNAIQENAANGSAVGISVFSSDADATNNTVTYSLDNNAGGRFAVDAVSGQITVANGTLLDREATAGHLITARATSSDGSFSVQSFTIAVVDANEFAVGAVADANASSNTVLEGTINGATVGITASAGDNDATNNAVTYSLDDDAGGRFAIDANSGIVTVANSALLDREAAASYDILIRATSADGSFSTQTFTIGIGDINEFAVTALSDTDAAINEIAENSSTGAVVRVTAFASDADATTNAIAYSLDDDAGGRFAINAASGLVTVANGSLLDRESAANHDIVVRATSADGSFSTQTFTIGLADVNEFTVSAIGDADSAANVVAENSGNGTVVNITAAAADADATNNAVTYSLDDDAGGRFAVDASTGVVTVADGSLLDRELAASHGIVVRAQSADGSFSTQAFVISLADVNEFTVGPVTDTNVAANAVAENSATGTVVGTTAFASDADATANTITYSLDDNAGGRFTIDATTGVVTVANGSLLDAETAVSHAILVRATSNDGSFSTQTFVISLTDVNEFTVGPVADTNVAANAVAENSATGTIVGTTAFASDADATANAITYSLDDDAGGRFAINATTGVVTVANGSLLDAETAVSHAILVRATSNDGSFSTQTFVISLTDVNEFTVGPVTDTNVAANAVAENSATGTVVGTTAFASDADSTSNAIAYSLDDDAGGRFAINATTGVVTVANGSLLDAETSASHAVLVRATSADGSFSTQTFAISVTDVNEFSVTAIGDSNAASNSVVENAANGTVVGITATASDADAGNNAVSYSLDDDAGGRFAVDPTTGIVTVANGALLDRELAAAQTISLRATSADGSFSVQSFTIALVGTNDNAPVITSNGGASTAAIAVNEGNTGLPSVTATDADVPATSIVYSIVGGADAARFTIDPLTGALSFTAAPNYAAPLDADSDNVYQLIVQASDGSLVSLQSISVTVVDVNQAPDLAVPGTVDAEGGRSIPILGIAVNDADNNLTSLSLRVDSGRLSVTPTGGVSILSGQNGTGAFTLSGSQAAINQTLATMTYHIDDGIAATDTLSLLATDTVGAVRAASVPINVSLNLALPAATIPGAPSPGVSNAAPTTSTTPPPNNGGSLAPERSSASTPALSSPVVRAASTGLPTSSVTVANETDKYAGANLKVRGGSNRLHTDYISREQSELSLTELVDAIRSTQSSSYAGDVDAPLSNAALTVLPTSSSPTDGDNELAQLIAGFSGSAVTLAASGAVVWWVSRSIGLLTALTASVPAWTVIDPLPILARERKPTETDAPILDRRRTPRAPVTFDILPTHGRRTSLLQLSD